MIQSFKKVVFQNYANFNGRARRRDYWMFHLAYGLLMFVIMIPAILLMVGGLASKSVAVSVIGFILIGLIIILALGCLIPGIAVTVRRLHDIGKSGWWYAGYYGINAAVSAIISGYSFSSVFQGGEPDIAVSLFGNLISWGIMGVWIYFMAKEGDKGTNQYGPDPKGNNTFADNDTLIISDDEIK